MRKIDTELLEGLTHEAAALPRKRKNFNFHQPQDAAQRFLNAMEPGTYVRPHRHLDPDKCETTVVLRGKIGFIIFGDDGAVVDTFLAQTGGPVFGVDLAPADWHTLVVLEPGSVILECKPGPYVPATDKDFAAWAPQEGTPEAVTQVAAWEKLFH